MTQTAELRVMRPGGLPARGELRHFWHLTVALALQEMKLRYFGSVLGYLWSLLRPLALFSVLYVVFTKIVRFGGGIEHYPVYLLASIVLWTYFAETTSQALGCLVSRESLMRKIHFPRLAIPVSLALATGIHFLLNLLVVAGFVLASGIPPRWSWLLALPLIALLILFSVGAAVILATLYVKFRDLAPLWEVASQLLFWASPVIYVIDFPKPPLREIISAGPIASILTQMRHSVLDPTAPTAAEAIGGGMYLLIPLAIVAITVGMGLLLFHRMAPTIAEEL